MCTDHVGTTLFKNSLHMSILLFPVCFDFLAMLRPVTIFGNMHRPCQRHPKIVNNSPYHIHSHFS